MQQPPWPQQQYTNYSMPPYQPPIPSKPPARLVNQANKTTAIILFSVSYAISLFGAYYFGLLVIALIMQIVGFVFMCLI